MIRYLILLFVGFILQQVHGQSFDTAKIMLNVKFLMVDFSNGDRDASFFNKLIESNISYRLIDSKGFDGYIFFQIDVNPFTDLVDNKVVYNYSGSLIIGVCKTTMAIFRLRGFKENDFPKMSNRSYDCNFYTDKLLKDQFHIEGLDIDCLCKNHLKKYKKRFQSPCLIPLPGPEEISGIKFL